MTVHGKETRLEHLYPAARELFKAQQEQRHRRPALRWLVAIAAAGTVLMAGRWLLNKMDRNL